MIKITHDGTFKVIQSAVNKLVDFVKPTYGPAGNKVIIAKALYKMVVDDGVQIARDFELSDESEQAVVNVIKEVAIRTNDRVGDGTTSSLIMLQAIISEVSKQHGRAKREIVDELKKGLEEAKAQLLKKAHKISTREELERVARIAYNNPEISKLIADLLHKVGVEGVVTLDKSNTMETVAEHVDGLQIDSGYISPYMITDASRREAVLEKPYILLTNYRVTNAQDVMPIMSKLAEKGVRELVIVAESVENDALATLIVNRMQAKFIAVAVKAPTGPNKKDFLEDLALLTGATVFNEEKGNRMDKAEIEHLGRAGRVVVRENTTVIIGGKGSKTAVEKQKEALRKLIVDAKEGDKPNLEARLARLSNGIAVIKVGAPTETEAKALKYKVEDAVNATKKALAGGVVAGSGISLSQLHTSSPILNKALKYPLAQLRDNMGMEEVELKEGEAINAVTLKRGPFMTVGVVDPVEVLIAGIESAVSIASVLITSHGILVEEKDKPAA